MKSSNKKTQPKDRSQLFTNILRRFESESLKMDDRNKTKRDLELMRNIMGSDLKLDYFEEKFIDQNRVQIAQKIV